MDAELLRRLLHKVSNLLAVIETQATVARAAATLDQAQRALAVIETCGRETLPLVQQVKKLVL
jgi:hypothetical protein